MGISAVLITLNEEKDIARALSSVKWADEIAIVDSGSTDATVDIAHQYGAKVFFREFDDFSSQKNFALSKANNDWVLFIDADEVVPECLKDEISSLSDSQYDGYYIPRKNVIFGRELKYGGHQDDIQLRFFRKSKSCFENPVHEKVIVKGKVSKLSSSIEHYSTRDISEYFRKLDLYSTLEARLIIERRKKNKKYYIITKPLAKFLLFYVLKSGYRDGLEGFIFYFLSAVNIFTREVKYWELSKKR